MPCVELPKQSGGFADLSRGRTGVRPKTVVILGGGVGGMVAGGTRRCSLIELTQWTQTADKVLVF